MTALSGPITFNSSTGSDSTSSGCGPATAVSVMIQTSAGSSTATASPTTGYSVGDVMYVPSFTGRKFNVIASVGSGSLTFDDNWDDTSFGTAGYVGGKRATFDNADSRELFTTNFHTAVLDKIKTETDQTLTSQILVGRHWRNPLVIYADEQKTINSAGNFICFNLAQNRAAIFQNLKFVCSVATSDAAITGGHVTCINCQFGEDGSSTNRKYGVRGANYGHMIVSYRCKFYGRGETDSGGFASGGTHYNSQGQTMIECFAKDYETGFRGNPRGDYCKGNVITSCKFGAYASRQFESCANNIFHDISSDCITEANVHAERFQFSMLEFGSNIFANVSGHLINSSRSDFYQGDSSDSKTLFTSPALPTLYAYNSSNTFNNMPTFPVQTLTADPFVDAANGDFNLNNALGGGATLRSTKYTLGG